MTPDKPAQAVRRPRGRPNALSRDVVAALGASGVGEFGPAMKALPSDRHRAFVLALYEVPRGYGAHVKAAKLAGFGTASSSAKSWSVIASRLAHDERMLAAIAEEDERRIRASAPRAIRALGRLLENPEHRDHGRAIGMTLDRVHPVETTSRHHVTVEDRRRLDPAELAAMVERIVELARRFRAPEAPVIEHQPAAVAGAP
jgi:hypothetical protein